MANVTKGGKTANQGRAKAEAAGGDAASLRQLLDKDAAESTDAVVFTSTAGHLWLRPPDTNNQINRAGDVIRRDKGLFVDFGGVGRTRPYSPAVAEDASYIADLRETLAAKPVLRDVVKYNIRELLPDEPSAPFAQWDEWSADANKTALLTRLGDDHDSNVRIVKEVARYEIANKNRSEVLAMLDSLIASEASVSDAFEVEVSLVN